MDVAGLVLAVVPMVAASTLALNKAWEKIQANSDAARDLRNHCNKLLNAVHSSIPTADKLNNFFLDDMKAILSHAIHILQVVSDPRIRHVAHDSLERQLKTATGEIFSLQSILHTALQEAVSGSIPLERIQDALVQALSSLRPAPYDETRRTVMTFLKAYVTFIRDLFHILDSLEKIENETDILPRLNLGRGSLENKLAGLKQRMELSKSVYDVTSAQSLSWDALLQKRPRTYVKRLSHSEDDVEFSEEIPEDTTLAYINFSCMNPPHDDTAGVSRAATRHFHTRLEGAHKYTPRGRQWKLWQGYESLAVIRNRLKLDVGALVLYVTESSCRQPFIVLVKASDYEYGCCPVKEPEGLRIKLKDILSSLPLAPGTPVRFVCLITGSELSEDTSCSDVVRRCTLEASSALCIAHG